MFLGKWLRFCGRSACNNPTQPHVGRESRIRKHNIDDSLTLNERFVPQPRRRFLPVIVRRWRKSRRKGKKRDGCWLLSASVQLFPPRCYLLLAGLSCTRSRRLAAVQDPRPTTKMLHSMLVFVFRGRLAPTESICAASTTVDGGGRRRSARASPLASLTQTHIAYNHQGLNVLRPFSVWLAAISISCEGGLSNAISMYGLLCREVFVTVDAYSIYASTTNFVVIPNRRVVVCTCT
uniref:Secreted protein n=1 Tax=Panagrellus redivivus TaxID=6233 RepID=A0A7E4UZ40_PANRE